MNQLPDGLPTTVGQPTDRAEVKKLANAVEEALAGEMRTSVRLDSPDVPSWQDGARIGDAPPVPQPGRPAMSERATDASVMMIAGGFLSLCLGAAVSAVLYFSSKADPTVIIVGCAAPPAAFLALKALVKGVKKAALPDVHNHNYNGPVHQDRRSTTNEIKAIVAKTTNNP